MDLSGKNVVYVAGFGGIGFEACKQFMCRNLAVGFSYPVQEHNPKVVLYSLAPGCIRCHGKS